MWFGLLFLFDHILFADVFMYVMDHSSAKSDPMPAT